MGRRLDKYRKLPVFKTAAEILELANVIAETLKPNPRKEHLASEIVVNAMLIQVKLAGAEGSGLYSHKMQNAVLIKIAVQDMLNAIIFAAMVDINEEDYVQLMRDKVEEFRLVFVEWIRGFDKSNDLPDNWAIRFDASTPEQEKLEELMFDDERFFNEFNDDEDDIEREDSEEGPEEE